MTALKQYELRQWSLPGDTIVPVLNVTSRVFWLELDDKVLLDSYEVLQEGILSEVFSQKCSAAWQGARGERLTVGVMLPDRQNPGDWLNQAEHLWMNINLKWKMLSDRIYVHASTGKAQRIS